MKMRFLAVLMACLFTACGGGGGNKVDLGVPEEGTSAIGVNGFLWRASLDTLEFLPLVQADPAAGIILSDWYVNPDVTTERLRTSVFIYDRSLRADALRVQVFREERRDGVWVSARVKAETVEQIENAILERARELRRLANSN